MGIARVSSLVPGPHSCAAWGAGRPLEESTLPPLLGCWLQRKGREDRGGGEGRQGGAESRKQCRGPARPSDGPVASWGERAFALKPGSHSCPEGPRGLPFLPRGAHGRAGPGQGEVQSPVSPCPAPSVPPHHLARDLCQPGGGVSVVSFAFLCSRVPSSAMLVSWCLLLNTASGRP